MSAQLTINQAGLPSGVVNQARSDGLHTGALVTLASIGQAISHDFELLWAPEDDFTALSTFQKINATTATFSPDPTSVGGTYRIKLSVVQETGPAEVIRCFSILTSHGLRIPALNERANEGATLATGPSLESQSEFNEPSITGPFSTGNYGGWFSSIAGLIRYVNTLSTGGGTGDVVGPASAISNHIATYSGTTGKLIADSGQSVSSILTSANTYSDSNVGGHPISGVASATQVPTFNGTNVVWSTPAAGGTGDVVGPASAVANNIAAFNGITGKLIADSGITMASVSTAVAQNTRAIYRGGCFTPNQLSFVSDIWTGCISSVSSGTWTDQLQTNITRSGENFTVALDGVYSFTIFFPNFSSTPPLRGMRCLVNGTMQSSMLSYGGASTSTTDDTPLTDTLILTAGDVLKFEYCNSTGTGVFGPFTNNQIGGVNIQTAQIVIARISA